MITMLGLFFVLVFTLVGAWRGALRIVAAFAALLLGGLLASPLKFLTSWAVAATGQVPRLFLPLASTVASGILLFLVFLIPMELYLRKRQRHRVDDGLDALDAWERYLGAGLGGLWGLCITVLVLLGISSISRVDRAMRVANAEIEFRAQRRQAEERRRRQFASITHTKAAPVGMDIELADVDPKTLKVADAQGGIDQLGAEVDTSIFAPLVKQVNPVDDKREEMLRNLAVVVGDPVLFDRFQSHPSIAALAQDPRFQALAQDKDIAEQMRAGRYRDLMDNDKIGATAQDPQLRSQLAAMNIDQILKDVKSNKKIRTKG